MYYRYNNLHTTGICMTKNADSELYEKKKIKILKVQILFNKILQ